MLNVFGLVDLVWGAFHKRGRCVHDLFAGTLVIVTDSSKAE
jgi:uncharacterized RDD family membrane protein YckC